MVRNTVSEVDPSKSENQSNLSNLEHIQEIHTMRDKHMSAGHGVIQVQS